MAGCDEPIECLEKILQSSLQLMANALYNVVFWGECLYGLGISLDFDGNWSWFSDGFDFVSFRLVNHLAECHGLTVSSHDTPFFCNDWSSNNEGSHQQLAPYDDSCELHDVEYVSVIPRIFEVIGLLEVSVWKRRGRRFGAAVIS